MRLRHRLPRPPARRRPHSRPRLRPGLALRREPRLWWALVLMLALGAGWAASAIVSRAESARLSWGAERHVLVARHDLAAGHQIGPHDVELVARPAAMVPHGALDALPVDAVTRVDLFAGEVLVAGRLAPLGLRGVAARLPPGTRAVAIPLEAGTTPPLTVGDRVDLIVALAREAAGGGPPGFTLAAAVLVVAVDDTSATVAVSPDVAPRVAVALGEGAVYLALVGA